MTRCKVDDIAIVTRGAYSGTLLRCLAWIGATGQYPDAWKVELLSALTPKRSFTCVVPPNTTHPAGVAIPAGTVIDFSDSFLRPLRGDPEEETRDESEPIHEQV